MIVDRLGRLHAVRLQRYAAARAEGHPVIGAGAAAGVSPGTAYRYERWLAAIASEMRLVDGVSLPPDALSRIWDAIRTQNAEAAPATTEAAPINALNHPQRQPERNDEA